LPWKDAIFLRALFLRWHLNRVWKQVQKSGIFVGLLALVLGVPIICSPYTQSNVFLIKTVFLQSLVFALFLLWLGRKSLSREPVSKIPLKLPLASLLTLGALSLAFSPYRYAVFEEFLRFLSFFLLYVLIIEEVRGERRMTLMIDSVLLVTFLTSLYGILQRLGYPLLDWVPRHYTRVMSSYGNPNFFGTHLVAIIPLLLVLSLGSQGRRKLFSALALMSALACLLFSETRSAWIGFAFSLVFLTSMIRKTKIVRFGFKTLLPLLAVLLMIILLLFLSQDVVAKRISRLWSPHGSVFMRIHTWEATLGMIKGSPILGTGLGTFQIYFPGFKYLGFESDVRIGNVLHAHNEYLEIWAEMGLLGLVVFLWLAVSFFRHTLRNLKEGREGLIALGLISGIAGVLVDSLFSSSMRFTGPAFTFWFLFGLAVATTGPKEASSGRQYRKPRGTLAHVAVISVVVICSILIARWHIQKYSANAHVGKGLAFLEGGSRAEAISELQKGLNKNPRSVVALYLLGCLKVEEGDFPAAQEWFRRVERLAPDFANIHAWRGYLLFRSGDMAGAEKELKICTRSKNSVFLHNMLGRVYLAQEKWDLAARELEQSLYLAEGVRKPEVDTDADLAAGEKVERPVEAMAAVGAEAPGSLDQDETANARIMLAKVYYEKKEYEKSIEQLKRVEREPLTEKQANRVSQLYKNIAWHYAREAESLDRALDLCERALRLNPPNPELVHDTRAWVYYQKGNLQKAEAEMKRAVGMAPENEVIKEHLSIIQRAIRGDLKRIDLQEIR
jgi:O-antigen ligase/tetratricopeptide (TPR) repeat protein